MPEPHSWPSSISWSSPKQKPSSNFNAFFYFAVFFYFDELLLNVNLLLFGGLLLNRARLLISAATIGLVLFRKRSTISACLYQVAHALSISVVSAIFPLTVSAIPASGCHFWPFSRLYACLIPIG